MKKKKLIAATMSLMLALVMLVGVTFAWYTISLTAEITNVQTVMQATKNMEIARATDPDEDGRFWSPAEVTRDDSGSQTNFGGVVTDFAPAVIETAAVAENGKIISVKYDKNGRTSGTDLAKYPDDLRTDAEASPSDIASKDGLDYYQFNVARDGQEAQYRKAAAAYYVWLRTNKTGAISATVSGMQLGSIEMNGLDTLDPTDTEGQDLIAKALTEQDIYGRVKSDVTTEVATGANEVNTYYKRVGVAFRVADMKGIPTNLSTTQTDVVDHVTCYDTLTKGSVLAASANEGQDGYLPFKEITKVTVKTKHGSDTDIVEIDLDDIELVHPNDVPHTEVATTSDLNSLDALQRASAATTTDEGVYEYDTKRIHPSQFKIKDEAIAKYNLGTTTDAPNGSYTDLTVYYSDDYVRTYAESVFFGDDEVKAIADQWAITEAYYKVGDVYYSVDVEDIVVTGYKNASGTNLVAWESLRSTTTDLAATDTDLLLKFNGTAASKYGNYDGSQLYYKVEQKIIAPYYTAELGDFQEDIAVLVEVIVYLNGDYTFAAYNDTASVINVKQVLFENQTFDDIHDDADVKEETKKDLTEYKKATPSNI